MSIEFLSLILFVSLLGLMALGVPIAFALGAIGVIFGLFFWGWDGLFILTGNVIGYERTIIFVALPLFIFMGIMLERSGIADKLYDTIYKLFSGLRGGLAVGTVIICTLFAAMTGLSGPAAVTMGIIALPSMLKRGYAPTLAIGSIMGGAALGPLIPPSATMILYGFLAKESIGRLYAGGILPGLLLSALMIVFILVSSWIKPEWAPAIPDEERPSSAVKIKALGNLILPMLLIVACLGSIFSGFATPTEGAAIGAFGSIVLAASQRKLDWAVIQDVSFRCLKVSCMVMWVVIGASVFTTIYTVLGADKIVYDLMVNLNITPWGFIIMTQIVFLLLGCLLDPTAILMITMPLFIPIIREFGFDTVWYGVLFVVNMELSYLTPPVGFNLFYMRGVAPKEIRTTTIYKAAIPFLFVQLIALIIVMLWPDLVMFLPNLFFNR